MNGNKTERLAAARAALSEALLRLGAAQAASRAGVASRHAPLGAMRDDHRENRAGDVEGAARASATIGVANQPTGDSRDE